MSTLKSIADIFERRLFRIPDYQRGYSWEEEHLQDFWDDLNRLSANNNHYTGLLTLQKAELPTNDTFHKWEKDKWLIENSGFLPFYVVDGQQRLTTIIILLQQIINKIPDNQALAYDRKDSIIEKYIKKEFNGLKSYIFGYEYNDPSYEYLKAKIFKDEGFRFNQPMTVYTRNLENSRRFFEERLSRSSFGELEVLFRKLTLRLLFNVYEIESELDVFVTFETTNNRGKSLSRLELLKNRLIYLTTIAPNNDSQRDNNLFEQRKTQLRTDINEAWKVIYEYLGKNENNQLDDDDFLRNHYYMYYGYDTKKSQKFASILLNEKFTSRAVLEEALSLTDIEKYVNSISKSVIEWFKIKNPEHEQSITTLKLDTEVASWLSKLNRLGFSAFNPCLMALMLTQQTSKPIFLETVKVMERYIFLLFRISKRKDGTGKNRFYNRARSIYFTEINSHEFRDEINRLIDDPKKGHDRTMGRFKSRVIEELFKATDSNSSKFGFSGWSGLRYFLFEYELYLQGNNDNKVTWESFNRTDTIEHIFPQNNTREYWTMRFNKFSDEQKSKLLHNLGNLLLLSRRKNSMLQNYDFDYKKKHLRQEQERGYFNGSYSENQVNENEQWTEREILNRGIRMLDFMEYRWNIEIGDSNSKQDILLLGFLP